MNALRKISCLLILGLALGFTYNAKAQDIHYEAGYFSYEDDTFNMALSDEGYYGPPPAYEIISSNNLSDVVSMEVFSVYDYTTNTYTTPTSIAIADGSATNFSSSGSAASFQLTAGQWVKFKVTFPTLYGNTYQYVSFYRDL